MKYCHNPGSRAIACVTLFRSGSVGLRQAAVGRAYNPEANCGHYRTQDVGVPLSGTYAREAGPRETRIDRPLVLETAGRLGLVLRDVRLSHNESDAVCPSR